MEFSESLKKYGDFQRVYRNGKSYANRYLVMYVWRHRTQQQPVDEKLQKNGVKAPERAGFSNDRFRMNHIGISVSKKVGNSVVRHRITRLVREAYRRNESKFEKNLDLVVVARPAVKGKSYSEVESALLHLCRLHHIVNVNTGEGSD